MRYPRGTGYGIAKLRSLFGYNMDEMPTKGEALPIGKGRIVRRPRTTARQKAVILSIGTRLAASLEAAIKLEVSATESLVYRSLELFSAVYRGKDGGGDEKSGSMSVEIPKFQGFPGGFFRDSDSGLC